MAAPILIFGAHGGIGEALARRLAAKGYALFLTGRSESGVAAVAEELGAPYAACDVFDDGSVKAAVGKAASDEGLKGLAYCVGSIALKPLRSASSDDFVEHFRLNAVGAAMALQAAHEALAKAEGAAVLFSTVAVAQGFANHSVIAAAKGGVEGLVRSLAAEFAPKVRVNAVAPSLTKTQIAEPMTRNEQMLKGIAGMHPIPRIGAPEEIAAMAEFLLGPDGGWITGQVFGVDGGRSTVRTKG
jgi:NAD(P)-dependent dehydrogenase (short-subunit alcohol dehydrogenase family)